jgi:hypothetical protein
MVFLGIAARSRLAISIALGFAARLGRVRISLMVSGDFRRS